MSVCSLWYHVACIRVLSGEYYFVIIDSKYSGRKKVFLEIRHLYLIIKLVCCWYFSRVKGGKTNPYFPRIVLMPTEELFESGKIKHILISGDNCRHNYNVNSQAIERFFVRNRGTSKESLVLDFAGLRTLDSMVRSKEIFDRICDWLVSQQFHNESDLIPGFGHYG